MSKSILRIHPAIAFARVGNSEDYYLAPETMAGVPVPGSKPPVMGGLPIRRGTENDHDHRRGSARRLGRAEASGRPLQDLRV